MNSLARSEDRGAVVMSDAVALDSLALCDIEASWEDRRASQTTQSGLSLRWKDGLPLGETISTSRTGQLAIKRVFDIFVSMLAVIALMPLFVVVALCIVRTSKGPVLFSQQREGLNGQSFRAFKFRSMRTEDGDPTGVAQTMKNDPRITAIGRFIRKTSIDELPQLINVLLGDMSLVGPRPHVAGMRAAGVSYRVLVPYYDDRLVMRPGITGWAQANGYRGMTVDAASSIARVDHDIAYVQNFSLWLDLKIMAKTVAAEFVTGSGH